MTVIESALPKQPDQEHELATLEAAYQAASQPDAQQPPLEAVFDAGEIHCAQGLIKVGRSAIRMELAVPENLSYNGLSIFVPGYYGIYDSSIKPMMAAAQEGFATLRFSPGRHGKNIWEDVFKPQKLHVNTVEALVETVPTMSDLEKEIPNLEEINFDEVLLLAHSMGLLAALLFAKKHPEVMKAVFGYAGCGLGHPGMFEVGPSALKGALPGIHHEIKPSLLEGDIPVNGKNGVDFLRHATNLPRTGAEGISCTRLDLRQTAAEVKKKVPVAQQTYQFDALVEPDPRTALHVTHYEMLNGLGHMAPIRKSGVVARSMAHYIHSLPTKN